MSDLDDALERFQRTDLEYRGGLANHGPMAAEALVALGHGALIGGLVDVYAPRLAPLPPGAAIPERERAAALGDPTRMADWVATFDAEIASRAWRDVLAAWAPRLLPGLFAGAAHGLLRTAHAVRALGRGETAVRRRELGFGLAYWAARYQELPGRPGCAAVAGFAPAAGFAHVDVVPPAARVPGLFFAAVRALEGPVGRSFVEAVERVDLAAGDPLALVGETCRAGAARYLENPGARVAYAHCVTAPSALRLLAPHLGARDARAGAGFALQAALALHAVSGGGSGAPSPEVERLAGDTAEIRYRAACSLEEHAIKLAEACLREDAIRPDPVLRLAAADAAIHLDAGAGRGAVC